MTFRELMFRTSSRVRVSLGIIKKEGMVGSLRLTEKVKEGMVSGLRMTKKVTMRLVMMRCRLGVHSMKG